MQKPVLENPEPKKKRYVVRKYVMATSILDAYQREQGIQPEDIWLDDDWKKAHDDAEGPTIGFQTERPAP